ncbi:putative inorganic pyrophosphatase 1-like [Capsicum annuum]|uniref:Inorganic pyrophosphatase 1-like n=1 Tax=Capsicum annuum TaxID=4072 RepID=A0A2G2Y8S4_CAPAN|nr:putative inorganic pyrophosphatase 1-like [Capsicum annuum]KAF3615624.1 putative inorganic pyrophosphatase 1-like [Capsicum annuum]PHT66166.1 hypothetical protein T459_30591 [Capsicum annuum]
MAKIVVVSNFSKTIIDLDNDNWVVDEFCATDIYLRSPCPYDSVEHCYGHNDEGDSCMRQNHHSGIKDWFSEINTNLSYVDDEGKLRIRPYHNFDHKCDNPCPPNMCKGLVIERMQESFALVGNKKRMIYLGDGAGDFFPSLMLKEQDFVMPRKDFPV